MNILKFIKSLFVKEQPVTVTETTTIKTVVRTTTLPEPVVLSGEAAVVAPKRKKAVKRKK